MLTVVRVNGNWYVIIWIYQSNIVNVVTDPLGNHPRDRVGMPAHSRLSTHVKLLKSLPSQIEEQDWVTSPVKRRETDEPIQLTLPWGSVMVKGMRCVSYPRIAHRAGVTVCDEEGVDVK